MQMKVFECAIGYVHCRERSFKLLGREVLMGFRSVSEFCLEREMKVQPGQRLRDRSVGDVVLKKLY